MTFISANPQRKKRNTLFAGSNFDYLFQDLMNTSTHNFLNESKVFNQPAVNIIESNDDFKIEMAIPGLSKKDIDINVDKNALIITAKKEGEKKKGEKLIKKEFSYYEFSRSFRLPKTIDKQAIKANFKNGILSLVLTKKEEAKEQPAKRIEIN